MGPPLPQPALPSPATAASDRLTTAGLAAPTFAELVRQRERGKLKIYVGSSAGVGKTYRMARVDVALEPVLPRVYADRARLHEALALLLADAVTRADGGAMAVSTVRAGTSVVVTIDAAQRRSASPTMADVDAAAADESAVGGSSPDVALATRLLEIQGSAVRADADRIQITLTC